MAQLGSSLALGLVLVFLAGPASAERVKPKTGREKATQAQEDLRKSLETWGWVSYGVAAAAIAAGVVLYVAGWPSDKSTNVALLPALAPDGASMILEGRF